MVEPLTFTSLVRMGPIRLGPASIPCILAMFRDTASSTGPSLALAPCLGSFTSGCNADTVSVLGSVDVPPFPQASGGASLPRSGQSLMKCPVPSQE